MEKTVVLFLATGGKEFTASLAKLVENYVELLASQGLLNTAMEYLRLLGSNGFSQELDILQDRIAASIGDSMFLLYDAVYMYILIRSLSWLSNAIMRMFLENAICV